ncbi:MAG: glucose 1-dehydrogenase [Alphaproteobacteria bacterium]|nr:glucose 1-dehydrogenase [Alphaproteobacteria bacterium]
MKAFDLTGRVALVTGGNGGIGFGMAKGLAEAGATVAILGRNRDKNGAALAMLAALGRQASAHLGDVTSEADLKRVIAEIEQRHLRLDIVINNAGINIRKRPEEYALAEWRQILDTNLTSAFIAAQAAYPAMKRAGGGKIINIGSMMSIFGASFAGPYAASKGGIVQLTRALASAWAADNIQVNAVLPGWIDTELTRRARSDVPGLHERVLARTPAGRWGRPEDHAGIAVFLASAASDFVTGTAIPVDGGYSVQG